MFFFRDGLAPFFGCVGFSRPSGGLWQFFVGAVVTGNFFVKLARSNALFRVGLAQLQCRSCVIGAHAGSPVEPSQFVFKRCEGKYYF